MTKKEYVERYGEETYQRHLEHKKQYYQQNKEKFKQYDQQYRKQHIEKKREYQKQWRRKHTDMFAFCIPEEWEQIENYELAKKDNFNGWCIHHRLETHNSDGEKRLVNLTRAELKTLDMYYNRPASELVFLTNSDHMKLHRTKKRCSKE